jgi:lysophospholipase L1-like esterase
MIKKILAMFLALVLLTSCGAPSNEGSNGDSSGSGAESSNSSSGGESSEDTYNVTEEGGVYTTEVNSKSVRFIGRVYQNMKTTNDCFMYGSSGIEFNFSGSKLSAEILTGSPTETVEKQQRVAIFIDDFNEPYKIISLKDYKSWYDIATGLSNTEHKAKIVKINNAGQNLYVSVLNLKTQNGGTTPTEAAELTIEFIGDSITAGHGIEGGTANSASVENSELTYAALTAKYFGADYRIVARSGVSLVYGTAEIENMYKSVDYYNGKKNSAANVWDCEANQANIIVINIGTNDYWSGIRNQADELNRRREFATRYAEFLRYLRNAHQNATIVAALGPMTYELMDEIESAVESLNDRNIYALRLAPTNPSSADGVGTENHPSIATNKKMADTLIAAIQRYTGLE